MALGREVVKFAREKLEKSRKKAAAKRDKIEGANPFGRIRRLDPEPTRSAQDKRRAGR